MQTTFAASNKSRHDGAADAGTAMPVPIHELGSVFVLTQLLATTLPSATAIEALKKQAHRIGWEPVSDVLRSAIERSLARRHLLLDTEQRLAITAAGRQWLAGLMAQNFAAGPICCSDMLRNCQQQSAARLPANARSPIVRRRVS
ncbi:MAG TPA: hypothetical protein VM659_01660 [Dongiaceae bacterium]|nr:hypothetical protein [Dongiaceae bacterium]